MSISLSRAGNLLQPLVPTALFVLSGLTAIVALHFKHHARPFFLLPSMFFAMGSILWVRKDPYTWIPEAFSFCQGLTAFYQLLWLPILLCSAQYPSNDLSANSPDNSTSLCIPLSFQSVAKAYRQWNNPRMLALQERVPRSRGRTHKSSATAVGFSVRRGIKIAVLHLINTQIAQPVFDRIMSTAMLVDFAPESEPLIRRMLFTNPMNTLDSEQFAVRVLISFYWIWHDFLTIETCHAALAILFVAILDLDNVDEWPALYGNLLSAWSVKRFWGRYWHRIMATTYSRYARFFSRTLCRSRPGTSIDKLLVAFGIFSISGLGHALVNWRTGEVALARDLLFFIANFAAVALEVYVSRVAKACLTKSRYESCAKSWQMAMLGYLWVWLWFLWIVPRWEFPRIYNGWIQAVPR